MGPNVLIVVSLLCLAVSVHCDLEVKLLHVLFRHGDKVPHQAFENYPTDPYRDYSYYPMGDGDLTNVGKMREYKIGRMLRERYNGFFGPDYWPGLVYGLATEVPRTQLSLQLVLAGLFPPSKIQTWNPDLLWIPTWTFTIPYEMKSLLFPDTCPRYIEEYAQFLAQDNVKDMINKYKNVFSYLTAHTGMTVKETGIITHLYTLFNEQVAQNLTLPKWTENVYPSPMKEMSALDLRLQSYTKTLRRLNGGMVLRRILDNIDLYKSGRMEPADRKAFLFSGHKVNVAALARTLGINELALPSYGSTIILETLRDKKRNYFVRVLVWTGVSEQLMIQTIPGCGEVCQYDEFRRLLKDVTATDEDMLCEEAENDLHYSSSSTKITVDKLVLYLLTASTLIASSRMISKSFA